MAVWLGGLAALLFVAPRATRELEPGDRGRLLAAVLSRFSQVALISVGAILLTGLVQAYVYVRHLDALIETGYGRAVLIKFCLLMVLIGIGAYNRRRSVPRLKRIAAGGESPGRAGLLLRRALRAEVALLVVVLGVTAALASYAPPVTAQSGPFSTETHLRPDPAGDDGRTGQGRRQRDPPLPLRREERRPVRQGQAARGRPRRCPKRASRCRSNRSSPAPATTRSPTPC